MTAEVSALSIVFMALSGAVGIALPIVLFVYLHRNKKADVLPFCVGCGVMLLFALILESIVHQLVLGKSPFGEKILNNNWAYALYGGLMAGLFEETGRFIAFKTVLKKYRGRDINALMYGAGHGGFEAVVMLTGGMISNIVLAIMLNTNTTGILTQNLTGEQLEQAEAIFETLRATPPVEHLVGIVERVFAVVLQISLSVFVWFAAKDRERVWLFPVSVLLHAAIDGVAVILLREGTNVWAIEGVIAAFTAAAAAFAWKLYKNAQKSFKEDLEIKE